MKIQLSESELRAMIMEAIEEKQEEGIKNWFNARKNAVSAARNNVAYNANHANMQDAATRQSKAQGDLDAANKKLAAYENSQELVQAVEAYRQQLIDKKAKSLGIQKMQNKVDKFGNRAQKYQDKAQNSYNHMRNAQTAMNNSANYEGGYQQQYGQTGEE